MTLLVKTPKQQARDTRDRLVAAEYYNYRKANPDASAAAIIRTIEQGGKFNLTAAGIQRILYRTKAITPKRS